MLIVYLRYLKFCHTAIEIVENDFVCGLISQLDYITMSFGYQTVDRVDRLLQEV